MSQQHLHSYFYLYQYHYPYLHQYLVALGTCTVSKEDFKRGWQSDTSTAQARREVCFNERTSLVALKSISPRVIHAR